MNKKIIMFGLLLINLKMLCSGNKDVVIPKAISCFDISYSDQKIKTLTQSDIKYSKYGFESNPLTLTYTEKTGRGVISLNVKILQRLKITDEQFSTIENQVKNGSSIALLEYNKEFPLKCPLYVIAKEPSSFIIYKIQFLNQRKLSEVDEAGYNSEAEGRKYLDGAVVGMSFGIVIGGTLVTMIVFATAIKKYLFS